MHTRSSTSAIRFESKPAGGGLREEERLALAQLSLMGCEVRALGPLHTPHPSGLRPMPGSPTPTAGPGTFCSEVRGL